MRAAIFLINGLHEDGLIENYAVGGAAAMSLHLEPAATNDRDVLINAKASGGSRRPSLKPINDRLLAKGATRIGGHVVFAGWQLHLHALNSPLVDEAIGQAEAMDAGGVTICVVTLEHLAALALAYGRMEDKYRLHQCIKDWHALDMRKFKVIVRRHDLERPYKDWVDGEKKL